MPTACSSSAALLRRRKDGVRSGHISPTCDIGLPSDLTARSPLDSPWWRCRPWRSPPSPSRPRNADPQADRLPQAFQSAGALAGHHHRLVRSRDSWERSEIPPPIEVGSYLGPSQLVQGDPVAARCSKRAARPVRDLQGALPLPASGLKPGQGGAQVVHPVHQNRAFTLDVIGQEDQRGTRGDLDGRDPGAHRLDGEDHAPAQHIGEVHKICGHVTAGCVQEVELLKSSC
jgi:hypothetical protein